MANTPTLEDIKDLLLDFHVKSLKSWELLSSKALTEAKSAKKVLLDAIEAYGATLNKPTRITKNV